MSTFAYCVLLETVNLPDTVEKIGLYTFAGCEYLEFINLENIKEFSDYSFASCVYLENVDLSSAEIIGEAAFADTYVSGSLVMNNLKVVKDYAFQGARIGSVMAQNLEEIGSAAFQNNKFLTSFTFSDKLTKVDVVSEIVCAKNSNSIVSNETIQQASAILQSLGYTQKEYQSALDTALTQLTKDDSQELIKEALKILSIF